MTAQERHERQLALVRASLLALPPRKPAALPTRDDVERAKGLRR